MSFTEILADYLKDKNEQADLDFMEKITKAHEEETGSGSERISRLEGELVAAKQAKEDLDKEWKEKYKKAFLSKPKPDEEGETEPEEEDPMKKVLAGVRNIH